MAPATTAWVKKKADRNCLSADPNDCLVWCLVDQPGGFKMIEGNLQAKTFKECPDGFDLGLGQRKCQRLNPLVGNKNANQINISTTEHSSLELQNWKTIKCQ